MPAYRLNLKKMFLILCTAADNSFSLIKIFWFYEKKCNFAGSN